VHASRRTSRLWRFLGFAAVLNLVWVSVGGGFATAATSGSRLWVKQYNGSGDLTDYPQSIGVSPDGTKVFVTGSSQGSTSERDFATVAYDAASGAKIWVKRYNGPDDSADEATALDVSPDGTKVFVTGYSVGATSHADVATIAYDAATGAELWVERFNGPRNRSDGGAAVGVDPDGSTVFVTGSSQRTNGNYLTIAYAATTGARLWVNQYDGPGNSTDYATALGVGPDGTAVFVTGTSWGTTTTGIDYATIAYDAATGVELWVQRHDSSSTFSEIPEALEVSADGSMVVVTGSGAVATVAYDASSGTKLWAKRYDGRASAIGLSPDGTRVFVTGTTVGTYEDYRTVAYDASTGVKLWVKPYNGQADGNDDATALGVSPDGTKVFVTGFSTGTTLFDYATAAYDAATGVKVWVSRYGSASADFAEALAVSPDGSAVFVTGSAADDYATVAYSA
jgi:outer membrane protein assembly factor BamB